MLLSFELVGAFLLMFIFMSVLWFIQRYKGEADIVDVGWAAGLGFIAIYYSLSLEGYWLRRVLLALLAATWSTRLASYLLLSRVLKPGEDGRYVSLRAKWGAKAQRNFFLFFQFQGLLVIIFSLPFFVVASHNALGLDIWDYIGLIIFLVSISGEWIADYQLANYKKIEANHGKTCRNGLWKYSRHPNYFFEWLHWWSYVALAVGSPYFWISLIGPTLMLFLILKVTGIPPTEKRALETKGEDYRNYQATTNAFFPWPPKKLT